MKVLYITAENIYGTGSSNLRNVSMIEGLMEQKNQVSILTFEPNERAKKFDPIIKNRLKPYDKFFMANHSVQKAFAIKQNNSTNSFLGKVKLFVYRIIKKIYLRFTSTDTLMLAVKRCDVNQFPQEDYDVVISSSDPISSHFLARKFLDETHLFGKAKWIQYWGDPLYLYITRTAKNKNKLKRIESNLLAMADKVVYTNPLALHEQQKLYANQSGKMMFVPTPFTFVNKTECVNSNVFDFGYFGSYMSCVRDIRPICEVCRKQGKKLIVVGGGDQEIPKSDFIDSYPFQSTAVVSEYESKCAVLVCLCNKSEKAQKCIQIPGKIYHYAMTQKPILVLGADELTRDYLSRFNRFYFAENTEESICKAIKEIEDQAEMHIICEPVKEFQAKTVAQSIMKSVNR